MQIKANGILMNYELSGRADGPVVAFSHSLASSTIMWEPQLEALEPGWRVLRYDTRGHGGSEPVQGPYSFELLADDLVGLLDALSIRKVHFVGLSMGGMIGQALGLHHAGRLLSLALCDTSPASPPEARRAWAERIEQVRAEGLAPQLEPTMQRWFTPDYLKRESPMLDRIRRQFLATPFNGYAGCAQAIMSLDNLDRLGRITTPTQVVVGEQDPGTPVSAARAIQERIAGARLAVIPAARHLPNVEQAGAFNQVLLDFLASI
jgi:3-oxoadipate enol-lactonase